MSTEEIPMPPVQILVNDANSKKVLKIDNIKSFTGVRAIKKSKGKKFKQAGN